MRRRSFITLLGGVASWQLGARAQQAPKPRTIGFLGPNTSSIDNPRVAAFVQRLRELSWIEGTNIAIEYRWADGRVEHLAEFAAEFVRLKVDVIVTSVTPAVVAAKPDGQRAEKTGFEQLKNFGLVVSHRGISGVVIEALQTFEISCNLGAHMLGMGQREGCRLGESEAAAHNSFQAWKDEPRTFCQ